MIVCHCAAVSDKAINALIEAGASSVRDIARQCGAGRCCAPCRKEIASMLDASRSASIPAHSSPEVALAAC